MDSAGAKIFLGALSDACHALDIDQRVMIHSQRIRMVQVNIVYKERPARMKGGADSEIRHSAYT